EIPVEKVRVIWGDTDVIPEGLGTDGSRSLTAGGSAALLAARRLKEELRKAAEQLLGGRAEYSGGVFRSGERSASLAEVVDAVYEGRAKASLEVYEVYKAYPTYPYGVHVAVVELDPETGVVKPVLHKAYDDVGVVVNPLLARGQVYGGIVQGYGTALYEEAIFDDEGNLATPNFAFYYVPTAMEAPKMESYFAEEPHKSEHPTGTKGIGEASTIAATPAIAMAVEDALRRIGVRARIRSLPIKPEYVYKLIRSN
ncbi:MAG: xanthine dehydrogenase family protein molybdopterin-binding subunit, partial [Thermoproteus sp.]|nr:xanthine dehydrogenase family protein molybdopterin-binding subunit [Thermoproteus sp.]